MKVKKRRRPINGGVGCKEPDVVGCDTKKFQAHN
jgi:hypothetical protein